MIDLDDLIAEMRERAEHPATGSNVAQCLREGARALEEAEARLAVLSAPQEDVRERLHAKCDCVPDLGPAHCHLCGNEKGSPVPWPECPAVRAAAPEPEWEYICQTDKPTENHLTVFSESLERARRTQAQRKRMGHLSSRIWGRRKAGPWDLVGGDDE